jgi:hypothetical protein
MYFFYIDESGTKDPEIVGARPDGSTFSKEHLYVLTAVSLYEFKWRHFEREITNLKLELSDAVYRRAGTRFNPSQCEIKSVFLRHPAQRAAKSPFVDALSHLERVRIANTFFDQLKPQHMHLFSVVVDKRKLQVHVDHDILFKKAYELLLERIEHFMSEFYPKHQALIVIDDNGRSENRSLTMKHAFIQREGNSIMKFRHIVEYPMFTDSALSNGIQLADLCGYNVYRAFRNEDFKYSFFVRMLDRFYISRRTEALKLDGLKVWPNDSDLVEFGKQGWIDYKTEQPTLPMGCS